MRPERFICHRTKAQGVFEDKKGKIFVTKFRKKDGSERRMVAKLAKRAEFNRRHPYLLVHDMQKAGAYRRINLDTVRWIADKHEEVYFVD